MRPARFLKLIGFGFLAIGMAGAASAQTTQGKGGRICRGLVSMQAAGKDFVHVWVRVNPDDSADVWTAFGPEVSPDAIAPKPPAHAKHMVTPAVSHFPNDFVGVSLPNQRGAPVMLSVSESAKMMATPRQKSAIACSP